MSRSRRWSWLLALVTVAVLWAICTRPTVDLPNDAPPAEVLPGRSDRDEAAFFGTNDTAPRSGTLGAPSLSAQLASARVEANETPIVIPATADTVRFVLTGATLTECRGEVSLFAREGMQTLPITDPEIVVPTPSEWRRIEFAIPGFAIAAPNGPFSTGDDAIEMPLLRAGTVVVDVRDTNGNALADRLVYCFPFDTEERRPDRHRYITTPWATTDGTGRAESKRVLPGSYNVVVQPLAEWREAETKPVEIREGAVTHCSINVPVLAPDKFGGFTLSTADCPFLVTRPEYCYHLVTDHGGDFRLWPIGGTFRCIVPGNLGEVVRGRVQWREGSELHQPSWVSAPIEVTIGAVPAIVTTWTEVPLK